MTEKPTCKKCSKPIEGEASINALDADWHTSCFTCSVCEKPIQSYFLKDGKPICKDDYNQKFLEACTKCSKPISGSKLTDNVGKHYHPECFTCTTCNVKMDGQFFVRNNEIKCAQCNEQLKVSEKKNSGKDLGICFFCSKTCNTSDGPVIVINPNERYHKDCFKCVKCKTLIQGEFYTLSDIRSKDYVCMSCS
ncbi:LIM domain protein [Heterostelium album PN500]|uniref:LIM domain protein n=1 Tax=Heterostelium pallidum (strain ATCC 26659 / Pp 5 / PN500) TaxID=670386 RepID=D3B1G9_HETP5|nr:LIM domain protein [Heterostelium album PN500]EFA85143.1 LIM domain protein [Heterostelium album PN500]|eukprot:XP_020437252.1 LIM domain protein [Heterostelium album PN500]